MDDDDGDRDQMIIFCVKDDDDADRSRSVEGLRSEVKYHGLRLPYDQTRLPYDQTTHNGGPTLMIMMVQTSQVGKYTLGDTMGNLGHTVGNLGLFSGKSWVPGYTVGNQSTMR